MSDTSNIKTRDWIEQVHDEPELVQIPAGEAVVYSRRSPDKETINEDAACIVSIDEDRAVLAVADGCGGMSSGDRASRLSVECLSKIVKKSVKRGDGMRAAILDAIEKANREVLGLSNGAAATLAVAEIRDGRIRPYHVGDAQILLVGNQGKIKLQIVSHSPVGYAIEAGVLSEDEAIHHEDRHIVSNVIGAKDCRIELGSRKKMSARDTLLIASDGVFDNLHPDEIAEIIRKGPLLEAATTLAALVSDRMSSPSTEQPSKPDDATFILFRLAKN